MGQAVSKQAVSQAQRRVGNSAVTRSSCFRTFSSGAHGGGGDPPTRPPPLGRPVADAPDVIEDATEALKERQLKETQELLSPSADGGSLSSSSQQQQQQQAAQEQQQQTPQPDQNSGFYRGQIVDPRDLAQEQFLAHQSGSLKPSPLQQGQQQGAPELAPDLLRFLQDMGPLEKKVNKDMTSPRIVKELAEGDEREKMKQLEAEANIQTREDMRLVENIEGFSTPRTTNFFSTTLIEEEEADFGLTDLEIYDLLRRNAAIKADAVDEKVCATFHEEKLGSEHDEEGSAVWTEEEKQQQQQLLRDTMKFLELPVVIKDNDMNYLGVYQRELDKEFAHQKADVVDESRVKLVLADLLDLGRKQIKRVR